MKHIVKRKGHKEEFDSKKLYASIVAACVTLRMTQEQAELIAQSVTNDIESEIKDKNVVTSRILHRLAADSLNKYNPEAAYIYDHHRDIS